MPGVARFGINKIKEHLAASVANGLTSVLLFGVSDKLVKVIFLSRFVKVVSFWGVFCRI